MIKKFFTIKRFIRFILFGLSALVLLFALASAVVYFKKDAIISKVIAHANKGYKGLVMIEKTDISPFKNFPYVSVKLQDLKVYETKSIDSLAIIDVKEAYLGFDFWRIIKNDLQIKK